MFLGAIYISHVLNHCILHHAVPSCIFLFFYTHAHEHTCTYCAETVRVALTIIISCICVTDSILEQQLPNCWDPQPLPAPPLQMQRVGPRSDWR